MSATKAIAKLLKLHSILKIAGVRFRRDGALMLEVKPFKNGARCPQCGRRGRRVRSRPRTRQWRDLPVAGREVTLGYAPREIVCRTHGRTEEEIPWAARHARVSYRFEYAVLRLCKVMTQKAAAQVLRRCFRLRCLFLARRSLLCWRLAGSAITFPDRLGRSNSD